MTNSSENSEHQLPAYKLVDLGKLKPYENNARTHDEAQVMKIAESLLEFGWTNPILADKKNGIIAGHGRSQAAELLAGDALPEHLLKKRDAQGGKERWQKVPVIYLEHLTEMQKRAYIIADNKLAELAGWDDDILQYELNALNIDGFDIELTGFKIDDLTIDEIEINEDTDRMDGDTDVSVEPSAKKGQIYQLGRHRLMCGDSTSIEDVQTLMAGKKAAMVFTDPPYNVNYSGSGAETSNTIMNDHMDDNAFSEFLHNTFEAMASATADNAPAYVCYASREHRAFENAIEDAGWSVRAQIIWVKNIASFGFAQYKWKHEPILYCVPNGTAAPWYGNRKQVTTWAYQPSDEELLKEARALLTEESLDDGESTIWRVDRDTEYEHPTQKPVRIPARAILNSSKEGDGVLDLFGGSGSTLIACEHTERTAYLMELDPLYVDKIITRWERLTGQKAEMVE